MSNEQPSQSRSDEGLPPRLDDPREDKSPPTPTRIRWIVSMMWDLGLYTQAREVQRLGDAVSERGDSARQALLCAIDVWHLSEISSSDIDDVLKRLSERPDGGK